MTFLAAGTCTIDANQLGNAQYRPAPLVQQSVEVGQPLQPQVITFTSSPKTVLFPGDTYTPAADGGGSGNPVTFTIDPTSAGVCSIDASNTVTFTAAGTCTIDANQLGNTQYSPASQAQQSVTVNAPIQ